MRILSALAIMMILGFASCRKDDNKVSMAYTPSFPVVKITSDTFFTIQVGATLPGSVAATAYDTFYKKSLDSFVVIDYSAVDITTPGLYTVTASARNQTGYVGYAYAYVNVVSNLASLFNFSGRYMQMTNGDTVYVTSKMNHSGTAIPGFYTVNNVAGVHSSYDSVNYQVPAFFVQQSNTQISVPSQYSPLGTLYGTGASCIVASADTAFQYHVINSSFGASLRVFKRF